LLALDLFSGCGGLTLGLKQARFAVVGAVEIDALAAETYVINHPEVKLWNLDIRKLTGPRILRELKLRRGQLDLLAGCPPCQGFSTLRTRNGGQRISDKRNDLVFEFLRLVKALRPKSIMMENVPALMHDRRMRLLKQRLTRMGYDTAGTPLVLNAADYGVPQRRRRMILLCSRVGKVRLPKISPSRRTVRDAIGKMPLPKKSRDPLHNLGERRDDKIAEMIRLIPKNGGSRRDLPKKYHLLCHRRTTGFRDVYGRMKWNQIAPTITSGCVNPSKGRFLHPSQNRTITLREAALLQSFPKSYRFSLRRGKFPAALMIGNALPPAFVRRHAAAVRKSLFKGD
jgi:DNA (cytosine-5)-methyltransferase 1